MDATVTLFARALRGEKVWQAHRDHAYQRLIRMGWSHQRLALSVYALMAACAASALVLRVAPSASVMAGIAFWILIYTALLGTVMWRWHGLKL